MLPAERQVDPHQRLLLLLVEVGIGQDLAGQVGGPVGRVEDAGLHVEGLGRDAERLGDLLEDLGRGAPEPAFDLAQVRVRDAGQLRQAAQREPGRAPLLTDECSQVVPPFRRVDLHRPERIPGPGTRVTTRSSAWRRGQRKVRLAGPGGRGGLEAVVPDGTPADFARAVGAVVEPGQRVIDLVEHHLGLGQQGAVVQLGRRLAVEEVGHRVAGRGGHRNGHRIGHRVGDRRPRGRARWDPIVHRPQDTPTPVARSAAVADHPVPTP